MFHVYILQSQKDKKLYIGYASNVDKRLARHNAGKVRATRYRRPLELLYCEEFSTELEARRREVYLKSWAGRIWLKNRLHDLWRT